MSCPREQGDRSPGCGVGDGRGRRRKQQSPSCLRLRKNMAPAIFRWRFGAPSVAPSRRRRAVCALVLSAWRWGTPRVPAPRAAHWSGSKPEEQENHTRREAGAEARAEEAWARKELHAAEVETCARILLPAPQQRTGVGRRGQPQMGSVVRSLISSVSRMQPSGPPLARLMPHHRPLPTPHKRQWKMARRSTLGLYPSNRMPTSDRERARKEMQTPP